MTRSPKKNAAVDASPVTRPTARIGSAAAAHGQSSASGALNNLCDLFFHELAVLDGCTRVFCTEARRLARHTTSSAMATLISASDVIAHAHLEVLSRIIDENCAGSSAVVSCPGIDALFRVCHELLERSAHAPVGEAAILAVLRRILRNIEEQCDAAAECAETLGFAELSAQLFGWGQQWRVLQPSLRNAIQETHAAAYVAGMREIERFTPRNPVCA